MNAAELRDRLSGMIAFAVTPFDRRNALSVDWRAFSDHIEFLAASGTSAIVVAGGTGEFFSLSPAEILKAAKTAAEIVSSRVPVLVGIGHGISEACRVARAAADIGVDGLLLMPPYYATPDRDALGAYYREICASATEVGVVVYARDHVSLDIALVESLAELPTVVAVKDGRANVRDFLECRASLGDRFKWIAGSGDDLVGAYASAGADGYTSSVACFDPKLSLRLWDLAVAGNRQDLDALLTTRILPWYELRRLRRGYEVAVIKGAIEAFGGVAGPVRPPLANLTTHDAERVRELATRLGPSA